ncbi:hypothetical protein KUG47_16490 [Falsochrobactrum sp. TDYN1]|uniref:Uncharacterized protein n=1 Tax=Falsochrobactrum tianjinense TaxID=2706015 RepID=A0A949UUE3_9HYPH|nr:hypothetical protein [Falsochrobactrum sp. TDYN1]MBV2145094.1 hypothetical protein [Falsochrobactrum sp. TDYN1]
MNQSRMREELLPQITDEDKIELERGYQLLVDLINVIKTTHHFELDEASGECNPHA